MSGVSVPAHLPDWIRDHIRRYLESDGADGHMWDLGGPGLVPTLLLTTTGAEIRQAPDLAPNLRENRKRLCDHRVERRSSIPSGLVPQPHRSPRGGGPG